MYEFTCPHCSIPLRIRDESFRNRTIECPECKQSVLIQESNHGLVGVAAPQTRPQLSKLDAAPQRGHFPAWMWIVTGATALIVLAGLVSFLRRPAIAPAITVEVTVTPPVQTHPVPLEQSEATPPVESTPKPTDPVEQKLLAINAMLAADMREQGTYPVEQAIKGEEGRSWISRLADSELPPFQTHWERGWSAPVNDEFVRRRFPSFDNPQIPQKSGDDNYPATHFVGVSGVGSDAAELPKTHPRAGIFSTGRKTTSADVTDGLSNTILVAGVESHLGSWARPGTATVRSFTREPYVRGPDGFGTGQPDSMLVLMADGSVRHINAKVEPVILRRMAAMADGLSLSPAVAGDPLTIEPPKPSGGSPLPAQEDPPILVELAPELPVFDLQPRLQQKIAVFELPQPVSLVHVLSDLQELIGVPLDVSSLSEETRQQPVSLKLKDVTVADILQQLGEKAGVTYAVRQNVILFSAKAD